MEFQHNCVRSNISIIHVISVLLCFCQPWAIKQQSMGRMLAFHRVLHSVGCPVIGNPPPHFHMLESMQLSASLKLLTLHHIHPIYTSSCWLLQYAVLPFFPHSISSFMSYSLSRCTSISFFSPSALSIAFYSFSLSLSPGVSESWAGTGGRWQEVGWLVLQVTLDSSGSPRAKYSPPWCGMCAGQMVVMLSLFSKQ